MKRFYSTLISGTLALSLVGCGGDALAPASSPVAAPRLAMHAPKPPVLASAPVSTYVYHYNPVGKRDPFRIVEAAVSERPVDPACNELLCQWEVEQLKLVAVVMGEANPMAMVEDPMGRGHIVRRNTRLGRQGGRVTQILQNEIVVTEVSMLDQPPSPVRLRLKQDLLTPPDYDLITGKPWGR